MINTFQRKDPKVILLQIRFLQLRHLQGQLFCLRTMSRSWGLDPKLGRERQPSSCWIGKTWDSTIHSAIFDLYFLGDFHFWEGGVRKKNPPKCKCSWSFWKGRTYGVGGIPSQQAESEVLWKSPLGWWSQHTVERRLHFLCQSPKHNDIDLRANLTLKELPRTDGCEHGHPFAMTLNSQLRSLWIHFTFLGQKFQVAQSLFRWLHKHKSVKDPKEVRLVDGHHRIYNCFIFDCVSWNARIQIALSSC